MPSEVSSTLRLPCNHFKTFTSKLKQDFYIKIETIKYALQLLFFFFATAYGRNNKKAIHHHALFGYRHKKGPVQRFNPIKELQCERKGCSFVKHRESFNKVNSAKMYSLITAPVHNRYVNDKKYKEVCHLSKEIEDNCNNYQL